MITPFVDQTSIQALAWSLVHFLWQGTVLGLLAFAVLKHPRLRATTRYVAGVAMLMAMLAAPITTFVYLNQSPAEPATSAVAEAAPAFKPSVVAVTGTGPVVELASAEPGIPSTAAASSRPLGPFVILTVWLSGVVLLSLRLLGGWIVARRLITRAVRPVPPEIHSLVRRVAGRMALDRVVRVFESSAVAVPVMVGWMKPVVLLPAAALSGLTPTQVEALIAHELAHIRRHDYIVNLLQSVVETLLFYHPAVWWVSSRVRAEREHCCDDLAVGVCDRLVYVTALADLAAMTRAPRVALAATDGSLVSRVRRILGRSPKNRDSMSSWMPAVVLALVFGAMLPASFVLARGEETRPRISPARAKYSQAVPEDRAYAQVSSGVSGGVKGGVEGGVTGGVVGGVGGGIPGGVSGGVSGGVTSGVVEMYPRGVLDVREGLLGDAAVKAAFAEPDQWRIEQDPAGRWRLARPRLARIQWRLVRVPDGKFRLVREGQIRLGRDPELEQAEAALRERIAQLEAELHELRRHYEEMKHAGLASTLPLGQLRARGNALGELRLGELELARAMQIEQNKLAHDRLLLLEQSRLGALFASTAEQEAKVRQQLDATHAKLLEQDVKARDELALAQAKLLEQDAKARDELALAHAKLFEQDRLLQEQMKAGLLKGKPLAFQGATTQGSGNFVWSDDGDRVAVKWTGGFRISDDDKDIVWVEPGKSVHVSNGAKMFSTGVEVKGLADGKVERTYYRNGFAREYEPEGREFLAAMLQKVVRMSGFGAESRVERFLKQGGVNAVLAEIDQLQGDYARRVYYRELMKQAKVPPAELSRMMTRASETIQSDYELASLLVTALGQVPADEAARVALIDATKTIASDYEMRRALTAALTESMSPKVSSSVLSAAASIGGDYERATLLIELAKKGGLTSATKAAYFELVKTLRSSHEQGRVLRSVAALPNMPEDVIADAVKASQAMSGDYERRQFLAQSIARQPVTSKSAGDVIQAAAGIRSDNEQATLLVDLVRRGGLTDETAASFFPVVASMTASYEQRRVLQAVLAAPQLSETVMTGLLKTAASITSNYERAEILVAAARKQPLSAAGRSLYLTAADTIRSEHDQTRVFAELVRAERGIKK
jgi:beta-lactamase regulating signal transducer with metallopeptidase domain